MSFLVSPELGRMAIREGLETPFMLWSILRASVVAENGSSHFSKKQAVEIASQNGLRFTKRQWSRIWTSGKGIFWGMKGKQIFIRSFRRVSWRFEAFRKACDESWQPQAFFVQISLSGGLADLRAQLYWAWFAQFEEKTLSRATISDLFGLSPIQQRAYEAILGSKLLLKTNYAHINQEMYKDDPQALPEYHFTVKFEREISLNQDPEAEAGFEMQEVTAYQYQLPNTFIASHEGSSIAIPVPYASNRAREALKSLNRQSDSLLPNRRIFWLNRDKFERLGSLDSFLRVYYQGKKRLWLSGHFS